MVGGTTVTTNGRRHAGKHLRDPARLLALIDYLKQHT